MGLTDVEPGRRLFERDEALFFQRPPGPVIRLATLYGKLPFGGACVTSRCRNGGALNPAGHERKWAILHLIIRAGIPVVELFDTVIGTGLGGRAYAEPLYRYLNRTGRAPFARIRQLLETWSAQFPELVTSEWLGRFQSDDDRHHVGAFFELYCRALLAGQGYTVEREPSAEGERQTKAEFLVLREGEAQFLLECTVAAGSEFGGAQQKRINRVYDALDRIHSPDFFVGVQVLRATEFDPPGHSLRHFVKQHLRALNVQEVIELAEAKGQEALPRWPWACRGEWLRLLL